MLGRQLANGAVLLALSQGAKVLCTILSTVIVARIILPEDYGVMAMVAPMFALTVLLQDLGFSTATIQSTKLSEEQSSALFWVNQLASGVLALLLLILAPLVAMFYGDVRAGYLTAATSIAILVSGASLQHAALLNREMRFAALSWIDIGNSVTTLVFTIGAALLFRNFWALYLGTLAGSLLQTGMRWYYLRWRPTLRPSIRAARPFVRFGGDMTVYGVLNFLVRNADNVIIARFAGSTPLGLYDRSYRLMTLPMQNLNGPIWRLLLPALSRLQEEPARYRKTFMSSLRLLLLALMPGFVVMTAVSDRAITFLLGPNWVEAGPIFFWLALAGTFQPLSNMTGLLMVSTGRSGDMVKWGIFAAITTLAGFGIGLAYWGALGVAASIFFVGTLRAPLLYALATRGSAVRQLDLYDACLAPLLGGAAGALAARNLLDQPDWILLASSLAIAYSCALGAMFLTTEGRATLSLGLSLGLDVLQRKPSGAP